MLGLVIHAALTYNITSHGEEWPLRDPMSRHMFSDFIVFVIHIFRMPLFFLIAGFFGAMLFYQRKWRSMVINRIKRIVFPFIIFLILLWPLTMFSFEFSKASFIGVESPASSALKLLSSFDDFVPRTTSHLWFLYYLIFITATTIIIALGLGKLKSMSGLIFKVFDGIIVKPFWRIIFISTITFAIFYSLGTSMITASVSLHPDLKTFIYFLFFYLIGWLLFKSKHHLETFMNYDKISFFIAITLVSIKGVMINEFDLAPDRPSLLFILISSISISLFIFSITGLFIRYTSNFNPQVLYLSNASYWVYLIHLPITAILPGFIWKLPLYAFLKFMIVCFTTFLICLVSYHYLVRSTFIGNFLNGRKYFNE